MTPQQLACLAAYEAWNSRRTVLLTAIEKLRRTGKNMSATERTAMTTTINELTIHHISVGQQLVEDFEKRLHGGGKTR